MCLQPFGRNDIGLLFNASPDRRGLCFVLCSERERTFRSSLFIHNNLNAPVRYDKSVLVNKRNLGSLSRFETVMGSIDRDLPSQFLAFDLQVRH